MRLPVGAAIVAATLVWGVGASRVLEGSPHAAQTTRAPAAAPAVAQDVAEGARLFVAYNCGDCHGAGGSGAMGPSLQDNRWRFGGSPDEIYRSITDGRPEGMPAWGRVIPREHTSKMVAYIGTLGAGKDVTTENFTGATVERSGR